MAKAAYKIPFDLNATYADMEIAIRSQDGIGLKPMPMKTILAYLLGFLSCFWVMMNTFVKYGTLIQKILFVAAYIVLVFVLCSMDATDRMQMMLIPVLLNYIPKKNRVIMTRTNNNAAPFYSIVGIERIDPKTGLIEFADKTYGYMYRVIGSASILLFDSDRVAILDRVDAFYRKLNTETEVCFITVKSSQAVYKQLAALKKTYDELEVRDPELIALANEQFDVLRNYVGGTFKSIHQYMILKCENKEVLSQTKNLLQSEVENSSRMIKRCLPLYYDDMIPVLETIYKGKSR